MDGKQIIKIFILLCLSGFGNPYKKEKTLSPYFISSSSKERIEVGGTTVLRCQVENLGESTLIWKKDGRMISAGNQLIRKDGRMQLIGHNLEISNINENDGGEYICNVETFGSPLDQSHHLNVLAPPSIVSQPRDGNFVVRSGSTITLECQARGNPQPTISWTRQNLMLPNGDKRMSGDSIVVHKVSRHHTGIYVCTADNGVGQKARAEISLQVLYSPEITIEHSWIKNKKGLEAEISCSVHAEPPATVRWYKDTMLLDQTENRLMETFGNKHKLLLTNPNNNDFGNYSCLADNSLGREKKFLEVSGRPHSAVITSPTLGKYQDKYNLVWTVDSFLTIEECRILYRNVKDSKKLGMSGRSKWINIIPPMNANPMSPITSDTSYTGQFMLYALEADTEYEAIIQTRNREGWSDPSPIFIFRTRNRDHNPLEMKLINNHSFHSGSNSEKFYYLAVIMTAIVRTL